MGGSRFDPLYSINSQRGNRVSWKLSLFVFFVGGRGLDADVAVRMDTFFARLMDGHGLETGRMMGVGLVLG